MRKLFVLALATFTLLAIPGQASARGIPPGVTVRDDPNEGGTTLDIAEVATLALDRRTFFGVSSWDTLRPHDLSAQDDSWYQVNIDTFLRARADRYLYLYYWPPTDEFLCELKDRSGKQLGRLRHAGFDTQSIYCAIRNRLLDIEKVPQFAVEAVEGGFSEDRAPDYGQGRYRGF